MAFEKSPQISTESTAPSSDTMGTYVGTNDLLASVVRTNEMQAWFIQEQSQRSRR